MSQKIRIAIDGPGGAGKSTIAKNVAKALCVDYIDTGAMYRAVAYKIRSQNINLKDQEALEKILDTTEIDFIEGNIVLDGEVLNDEIRTPEISRLASDSAALYIVREKLVAIQRKLGQKKSVIMDGRDIGTNVLTDAEFKFFMTASKEERAKRRHAELKEKGQDQSYSQVLEEITARDQSDMTRALNPLLKADDAILLDTTNLSIEEVTEEIIKIVKGEKDGNSKGI